MKTFVKTMFIVGIITSSFAQITFNGCHPLFEDQNYTFNFDSTDATGRNIYTTTPIDGSQTCGGVGTCEFKIAWNETNSVWEFLADDGNGDFSAVYLIYSNASASIPNPPSLMLGTWVENNTVTSGDCGGDLSTSNAVLTGDIQDSTLGIEENEFKSSIAIYPNPASNVLNIKTDEKIADIKVYNVNGKMLLNKINNLEQIDISYLCSGIYFLKINYNNHYAIKKIVIE